MKVLITGATGFVGTNLVPYLEKAGIACTPVSLRGEWQCPDMDGYNAVIHLAGKAHDTKNLSGADEYFKVNGEYTKRLFDAFTSSTCRQFIYMSSVKAVADTVNGVLEEDVEGRPATPYGQSKLQAEKYLLDYTMSPEKQLFILRPCMIHGPGNKGNLNLLYKIVAKGIPYPLGAYDNLRSFLSIDNLLYVIKAILDERVMPGIYNVADDEPLPTSAVVKIIAAAEGKAARIWKIPKGLVNVVAGMGSVLGLPLNNERLAKLTESYVVANARLKQALGIDSMPVSAAEGLKKTITSFKS